MRHRVGLATLAITAAAAAAAAGGASLQPFLAAQPQGCMVTPPAGQPAVPPKLARGDRMLVCIQLDGSMAVFDVGVDVFTGLQVAGSHNASAAAGAGAVSTLAVAAGLASSDDPALATGAKKVYWQPDTGSGGGGRQYLPTYTAVIQLVKGERPQGHWQPRDAAPPRPAPYRASPSCHPRPAAGEPTSVTFDDGCFFCDGASGCGPNALPVEGGPPVDGNVQKGCALPEAACVAIGEGRPPRRRRRSPASAGGGAATLPPSRAACRLHSLPGCCCPLQVLTPTRTPTRAT